MGLMIAQRRGSLIGCGGGGGGGGVGGCESGARAHGLGDDLELVGARLVVLLLVLDATVVLEEELAGLLEHPAALADGTVGQRTREYSYTKHLFLMESEFERVTGQETWSYSLLRVLLKK